MATDKFYVIENNIVTNIIVCTEEYAASKNLIKFPRMTEFGAANIDWTFVDNSFLPPPRDILSEWFQVRLVRNQMLAISDMAVFPDKWNSYTNEQKQAWTDYRQTLRDIPQKYTDPKDVVYPKMPE